MLVFVERGGGGGGHSLNEHFLLLKGDFAVFWSKLLEHLTKKLFCNNKLLLQHWEEIITVFLSGRTYQSQL